MNYEYLFKPLTVNGMTIKNRVMMTAIGTNFANPDGSMSPEHRHYYTMRAKGGTGLIIVENTNVDYPMGSNGTTQLRLDHDRYIPQLYKLCESVHGYGCKIAVQINFAGASAKSSLIGAQPISASNLPSKRGGEIPRPMTEEEIYRVVRKFGEAAKRAQTAGFDAVEIHASHSYLLNQFLSPTMNNRNDKFGGSVENRVRLTRLVAHEVRNQVGSMFPVFLRISADEFVPGGLTLTDTLEWLQYVDEYIDVYDVSAGLNDSMENQIDAAYHPDGWRSYMAKAVKERYNKPVVSMGNYRDPAVAEAVLSRGDADIIGVGRGLIADPDWVNKVRQGREDEINRCISCCIGCAGNRIGLNRPIRCTVNPAVIEGDVYKICKVTKPCSVVVIGGGVAGLEAACTAAEVGCKVVLFEKEAHLGGWAFSVSRLPDKRRIGDFLAYLIHRSEKLANLSVLTGVEATLERIGEAKPDLIVCATGSKPLIPPIPGLKEHLDKDKVVSIKQMINNVIAGKYPKKMDGKKIVVIGGGAVGLDIVAYFAPRGADISIVETLPVIGRDLDPVSKSSFYNLMQRFNVKQMPNTILTEVRKDSFLLKAEEKLFELPFDYGFICTGLKAYNPLFERVKDAFAGKAEVISIGDCVQPRRIIEGVQEGRDILKRLESLGLL
ncbi:MAG TPA: FAD-dependent oxidoreductase [Firmicutes bacterium]|jgi:2,4-dienoyl-CoA reductase-like NADH-dependent reductase (Old Yellow Enzyme family)/NADPH-dependent 2,4-dienoyl-CoA reductase/sulfur reductase-like enzyme|nr:FAD-dependent oxidoreductase [Bacillota bacterium]